MNHTKLDLYAFYWSEARLGIAAVALFLGGVPPVTLIFPLIPLNSVFLTLAWIISGAVSAYLAYRWFENGQKLFGHSDKKDLLAFFINVISGINLGIVGITGTNIGMTISSSYIVFFITALAYLAAAYHLYTRWQGHGQKLF
jgi:uncharacterized membrane protein YedE/YeeE